MNRRHLLVVVLAMGLQFSTLPRAAWPQQPPDAQRPGAPPRAAEEPPPPLPKGGHGGVEPRPGIYLQVNRSSELRVYQGTPLIFSVGVSNPEAASNAAQNEANKEALAELRDSVGRGEISEEQGRALKEALEEVLRVQPIRLGDPGSGWITSLRLEIQSSAARGGKLTWPLKLLDPPPEKTLVLGADNAVDLRYVLDPESAAKIPPGQYRIAAVLDVPPTARLAPGAPGEWRGRAESEPVRLTIAATPAALQPSEKQDREYAFARYYQAVGDHPRALSHAQAIVALNEQSISGHILVAEVKEAQNDLQGALAAYRKAIDILKKQSPPPTQPPRAILERMRRLIEKLEQQQRPDGAKAPQRSSSHQPLATDPQPPATPPFRHLTFVIRHSRRPTLPVSGLTPDSCALPLSLPTLYSVLCTPPPAPHPTHPGPSSCRL